MLVKLTGKRRLYSPSPTFVKASSVSPCARQCPHDFVMTLAIMSLIPPGLPLSSDDGLLKDVKYLGQRQVSAVNVQVDDVSKNFV